MSANSPSIRPGYFSFITGALRRRRPDPPAAAGRKPRRTVVGVSLVGVLTLLTGLLGGPSASAATPGIFVATLSTNPYHAAAESAVGLKVAMMELNWAKYEPQQGVFDLTYEKQMQTRLNLLLAAGMRVTLGLGLHYTPSWVLAQPNARFVDQYGNVSAEANLVFNDKLRVLAKAYFVRANSALHFSNFWALRTTSGGKSEVLYPGGGHYWAFDVNAQNGPAKPSSMPRNPFPGWKPGTTGLTPAQVTTWAQWYVGALADTVRWQALTIQHLGFTGFVQVVVPGLGVLPTRLPALARANLQDGTLGSGAAWDILFAKLTAVSDVVAYLSSVGDTSGSDVGCSAGDDSIALDDPATIPWSSARWLARVADQFGDGKSGENPGYPSSLTGQAHYKDQTSTGLLATSMRLATSCGYQGLYWAHDDQLWNGTIPLTAVASYSAVTAVPPAAAH